MNIGSDILIIDSEATTYEKGHPFSSSNRLMCVGTLFNGDLRYLDIEHSGLPYNESISYLSRLLSKARLIVGFNLKYDLHWLRLYSVYTGILPTLWDCQLGEFIIHAQTNPYPSLDFAGQLRGFELKHDLIATEYWAKGIDTDKVPRPILEDRVLSDVKLTAEVYLDQVKQFEGRKSYHLFRLQCEDLKSLTEMEYNGMLYDSDRSTQLGTAVKAELATVNEQFQGVVGSTHVNLNSPRHISAILYGGSIPHEITETYTRTLKDGRVVDRSRKGLAYETFPRLVDPLKGSESVATKDYSDFALAKENESRSATGKSILQRSYSTDEPTLRSLRANKRVKQIIEVLLRQSELEKLDGTYYSGIPALIERMQWTNNILHGQLNQCVARTGRLSSSKPNLQNFASILKALFHARNDCLINVDAKGLEWVCAAYLSQDPIAMREINEGLDTHELNRVRFGLSDRVIAKIFLFRLLYGGSAYSYAHDPDFTHVSTSEKFWQKVIDESYTKYKGLAKWHTSLVQKVVSTGRLEMPTGREYKFERTSTGEWPRTTILNYPVQGFGADLMSIIRVSLHKRMMKYGCKSLLVCTVHDSILIDALDNERELLCNTIDLVFKDVNKNFKKLFGSELNLPLRGEITIGQNWGNMLERVA